MAIFAYPEKSNIDKRFGELSGEIKDLKRDKDANKSKIEKLEKEKADLEKVLKQTPADKKREESKKVEQTRLNKYLDDRPSTFRSG